MIRLRRFASDGRSSARGRSSATDTSASSANLIVGWRAWSVVGIGSRFRLISLFRPTVWQPEEIVRACCMRPGYRLRNRGWLRHDAPREGCHCGIYASDSAGTAIGLATERGHDDPRVFGRVALWGLVAECEYGWKASNAYPSEIVVPEHMYRAGSGPALEAVALDLTDYGVPVSLADRHTIASLIKQAD